MVLLEGGWLMVFGWPHAWCLSSLKFGKVNAKYFFRLLARVRGDGGKCRTKMVDGDLA